MKKCNRCLVEKSLDCFGKSKTCRGGHRGVCKECLKQYFKLHHKEWTINNHQRSRDIDNKYRETHRGWLNKKFNDLLKRCNNPGCKDYKNYGGRGIRCLFQSFEEFFNYIETNFSSDIKGLHIDRIDNDGNYEQGNIRFVTQAENNKNRKRVN